LANKYDDDDDYASNGFAQWIRSIVPEKSLFIGDISVLFSPTVTLQQSTAGPRTAELAIQSIQTVAEGNSLWDHCTMRTMLNYAVWKWPSYLLRDNITV